MTHNMGNNRVIALLMGPDIKKSNVRRPVVRSCSPARRWGSRAQSEHPRQCKGIVDIQNSDTLIVNCFDAGALFPENGPLTFDYVGFASRMRSKAAPFGVLDHLFFDHRNTCLMILKGHQVSPQNHLVEMMAGEINKRIQLSHSVLTSIQLEYFDVRENGIFNMLERFKTERAWPHRTFKTTVDLTKWFRKEYGQLWSTLRGHECLDFQFCFTDANKRIYNHKLSLVHLYMYRMSSNDRSAIGQIFANIGRPLEEITEKAKSKVLLGCVKDYLTNNWCTCMTFEVPTLPEELNMTKEIIRVAYNAVTGLQKLRQKSMCGLDSVPSKKSIRSIHRNIRSRSETAVRHVNESEENFQARSIGHWTFKIDQQFSIVIRTMQSYYERVNAPRIKLLVDHARKILNSMDDPTNALTESPIKYRVASCQPDYDAYKYAIADFFKLEDSINQLNKNRSTLTAYIKSRNCEIYQQTQRCKAKYMRLLADRIQNVARDAILLVKK